jgi:hypothetical protein
MVPLLIGVFTFAAAGIGWLGYKANQRIAAWGENMNDCDDIFRLAGEDESEGMVRSRTADAARAKTQFAGQHLPTGPAASR